MKPKSNIQTEVVVHKDTLHGTGRLHITRELRETMGAKTTGDYGRLGEAITGNKRQCVVTGGRRRLQSKQRVWQVGVRRFWPAQIALITCFAGSVRDTPDPLKL